MWAFVLLHCKSHETCTCCTLNPCVSSGFPQRQQISSLLISVDVSILFPP